MEEKINKRIGKRNIVEMFIALIVLIFICIIPVKEYKVNLNDMQWNAVGNVNQSESKVEVNASDGNEENKELSAGPYMNLDIGHYHLIVDYSTDEKNNFVSFRSRRACGDTETKLDKFENRAVVDFEVRERISDFEIVINYCGKGNLTINSLKVVTSKIYRFYVFLLAAIVLLIAEIVLYYKKNQIKMKFEHFILLIGFLLALLPLLEEGVYVGDDYVYHLCRIESLKTNFVNGDFITKIHGRLADTYGYGTGFFYSDFFLIIPAILCYLGVSLQAAYKFLLLSILVGMLFVSYYTLNKFLKDKQISATLAVLLANSHYVILNLYGRTALGEALGYVFLILIAAGLYNLVKEHFSSPYLLVLGFCGVVLSHTISTVFAIVIAVIVCFIYIRTIFREKLFFKLITSAIATLLLTAWYWGPMIEQMSVQQYRYSQPWVWAYNKTQTLFTTLGDGKIELGTVLTIVLILGSIVAYKCSEIRKWVIAATIILVIVGNRTFWVYTEKFTNVVQFPWRLLGVAAFLLFIVLGFMVQKIPKKIPMIAVAAILIAFNYWCNIDFFDNDTHLRDIRPGNLYAEEEGELGGGKEWMPMNESNNYAREHPNEAVGNNEMYIAGEKQGLTFTFGYSSSNYEAESFEIPYYYYKGYQASYMNGSNEGYLPVSKSINGLVQVQIPEELKNNVNTTITVTYKFTLITKICIIVSIFSLIIFILQLLFYRRKPRDTFSSNVVEALEGKNVEETQESESNTPQQAMGNEQVYVPHCSRE